MPAQVTCLESKVFDSVIFHSHFKAEAMERQILNSF